MRPATTNSARFSTRLFGRSMRCRLFFVRTKLRVSGWNQARNGPSVVPDLSTLARSSLRGAARGSARSRVGVGHAHG